MKTLMLALVLALATSATASEPWLYPVTTDTPPRSASELNSLSQRTAYVEHLDVRTLDSVSTTIHSGVASLDDIVKWYSEKLGGTDLPKAIASYDERKEDAEPTRDGFATNLPARPSALIRYRFTPTHKQITILPPADGGDTVVVSLLGTKNETSIHVVRRHANQNAK